MSYLVFEKFWNPQKSRIDFLIFAPHPSINRDFITKIREIGGEKLSHISDEILYQYMYHEADTGVREVVYSAMKFFQNSPYSIGFLWVDIPRGFCDLNRPIELATPKILENNFWKKNYTETISDTEKFFKNSDFIFHFHSMNTFNPVEKKNFDECVSENNLEYIFEKMYSGSPRENTILTENTEGEYLTDKNFDEIFKKIFAKNNENLEENTAYRFVEKYPCTDMAKKYPSGFFELTKWSVATDATANSVNTNNIIFDEKKVEKMWKILSEIITEYLENFARK